MGTIKARIPCKHNAVAEGTWLPNVFKDASETDPARRYKMIGFYPGRNSNRFQVRVSDRR